MLPTQKYIYVGKNKPPKISKLIRRDHEWLWKKSYGVLPPGQIWKMRGIGNTGLNTDQQGTGAEGGGSSWVGAGPSAPPSGGLLCSSSWAWGPQVLLGYHGFWPWW